MPRVLNYHDIKPAPIPKGAEYIGRENRQHGLPQSKWHNPYPVRRNAAPEERTEVIRKLELYLYASGLIADVHELRGKDLVAGAFRVRTPHSIFTQSFDRDSGWESFSYVRLVCP